MQKALATTRVQTTRPTAWIPLPEHAPRKRRGKRRAAMPWPIGPSIRKRARPVPRFTTAPTASSKRRSSRLSGTSRDVRVHASSNTRGAPASWASGKRRTRTFPPASDSDASSNARPSTRVRLSAGIPPRARAWPRAGSLVGHIVAGRRQARYGRLRPVLYSPAATAGALQAAVLSRVLEPAGRTFVCVDGWFSCTYEVGTADDGVIWPCPWRRLAMLWASRAGRPVDDAAGGPP